MITGLVASSMFAAGMADVLHVQTERRRFVRLGDRLHFVTLDEPCSPKAVA
jgi:hypothetical protein